MSRSELAARPAPGTIEAMSDHLPRDEPAEDLLADLRDAGLHEGLVDRVAAVLDRRDRLVVSVTAERADARAAQALADALARARD